MKAFMAGAILALAAAVAVTAETGSPLAGAVASSLVSPVALGLPGAASSVEADRDTYERATWRRR